jgi:hypothetical protein
MVRKPLNYCKDSSVEEGLQEQQQPTRAAANNNQQQQQEQSQCRAACLHRDQHRNAD